MSSHLKLKELCPTRMFRRTHTFMHTEDKNICTKILDSKAFLATTPLK